jgi:endoribonuclease Dicer
MNETFTGSIVVLVHDVILASAEDSTATFAARRASLFALDALEGDAAFLTRTCDCRTHLHTKKPHKNKVLKSFFSGFGDDDEVDSLAVEKALDIGDGRSISESLSLLDRAEVVD